MINVDLSCKPSVFTLDVKADCQQLHESHNNMIFQQHGAQLANN